MTISKPIPIDSNGRWTAGVVDMGPEILDRMERAVTKVRERLLRATAGGWHGWLARNLGWHGVYSPVSLLVLWDKVPGRNARA